LLRFSC